MVYIVTNWRGETITRKTLPGALFQLRRAAYDLIASWARLDTKCGWNYMRHIEAFDGSQDSTFPFIMGDSVSFRRA